jgi:hypothetical protein
MVLVIPLYPYCIKEDRIDVPLKDSWYTMHDPSSAASSPATCVRLRLRDGRLPKNHHTGPVRMTTCSTYCSSAPLRSSNCPSGGPWRTRPHAGVVKLYEPSPTPCLYVAPAENMVGRAPPYPVVSGRKHYSNNPSRLQKAHFRRGSSRALQDSRWSGRTTS